MIKLNKNPTVENAAYFLQQVFSMKEIPFGFQSEICLAQLTKMGFKPFILVDETILVDELSMEILEPDEPRGSFKELTVRNAYPNSEHNRDGKVGLYLRENDLGQIQIMFNAVKEPFDNDKFLENPKAIYGV